MEDFEYFEGEAVVTEPDGTRWSADSHELAQAIGETNMRVHRKVRSLMASAPERHARVDARWREIHPGKDPRWKDPNA